MHLTKRVELPRWFFLGDQAAVMTYSPSSGDHTQGTLIWDLRSQPLIQDNVYPLQRKAYLISGK